MKINHKIACIVLSQLISLMTAVEGHKGMSKVCTYGGEEIPPCQKSTRKWNNMENRER